jgi:putative ABC transport system permease protein
MFNFLKIFNESIRQAFQQLTGNKLRSFLSLLGITIGIFCIIGVQSAVDSLESNVRGSLEELGDDMIFINKMPMLEDPHENYWKYLRRPNPSYKDYENLKKKVKTAKVVDFHVGIGSKTAKYRSNTVEGAFVLAVTIEFDEMFQPGYDNGRWYNNFEYQKGHNKVVIGYEVAQQLFGAGIDPIGRKIKLMGQKVEVIGVFEKAGESMINIVNFDEVIVISYEFAKKVANVSNSDPRGGSINLQAAEGVSFERLKDDITGVLRNSRGLRPKESNNFAINALSMLAGVLDSVFGALNMAGWIIGGFAIFVGIFSVANIMFVSVKERTGMIGIKKALGAKRNVILLEFLIESIILCILGGILGLILVKLILLCANESMPFPIYLSWNNVVFGISLSIFIGIISGFIPAFQASKMDPVEAMRH